MEPWVWSVVLLVLGLAIIVLEMFVPSGGVLGVIAAMCVVAAIVVAFVSSFKFGIVILLFSSVAIPALLALMIHTWPNTPLGRRILIQPPDDEDEMLPDTPEFRGLKEMIGKRGVAKSMMMPSGVVTIDGRTFDAVGEGTAIEAGETVQVIAVRMNRLEVRKVERANEQTTDSLSLSQSPARPISQMSSAQTSPARTPPEATSPSVDTMSPGRADELLSRPIESLGLESLDDPLA